MKLKQFVKESFTKIAAVFKRFPVAIICLAVLTVCLIAEVDMKPWSGWFLVVGAMLSLSMDNWRELCQSKKLAIGATAGVYLVHIVITVILYHLGDDISKAVWAALFSIAFLAFLSLFCLPFLRQKNDVPFWHFGFNLGKAAGISFVFTLVMFGGLLFILFAFDELFDLHIHGKIYFKLSIFSGVFAFPVIFMAFIPSGQDKMIESLPSGKTLGDKLVHFVIMPLFGIYLFVMYLLIISMFVHWELPKEMAVGLVSAAMLVALFLITRLYPAGESEENTFDKKLLKWLPIVMLPLLIVMSVGIITQISDKGLTVETVYLILFNIWCYAVCIYLFVTHSKRIIWVPVSFGLLFFVVSVLPLNVCKCVKLSFHHQVASQIAASGTYTLPLSSDDFESWMKTLDKQTRSKMYTRLVYMKKEFNRESIADLISDDVELYKYYEYDESESSEDTKDSVPRKFKNVHINMTEGKTYNSAISCNSMMVLEGNRAPGSSERTDPKLNVETGTITFGIIADKKEYTFEIDRNLIEYGEKNDQKEGYLILKGEQADLYMSGFSYNNYGDTDAFGYLNVSGLLCIH